MVICRFVRVKSLENLFVLEALPTDLTLYSPRPEVTVESNRIIRLAAATKARITWFLTNFMNTNNDEF